ncbi:MAG: hypothetical protein OEV99_13125, partial [Nitrospira sp.]|nr:hypothetical protein [Nitrospira sp.]
MRILVVTNMYPTPGQPAMGTFVEQQILGMKHIGLNVEVMFVDRAHRGMRNVSMSLGHLPVTFSVAPHLSTSCRCEARRPRA